MARIYENWLKAYVNHTRFSESPNAFHFWTGVATVAGALERKVWIDQLHFQWTPNFYIVLVGPPGVAAKSTSIRAGLSILEKIPTVHMGPSSATWQALAEALRDAEKGVTVPGQSETEIMSCLTIGVSELGTLLRPEDKEFVDLLTAMWDGQKETYRRKTKTQGDTVVHNPWLNIIGCTTPAWLKENFPDVLIGGGLTSRMVFVFSETKRQLIAYPAKHVPTAQYHREEDFLFQDLLAISELTGPYQLSKEAEAWGEEWYRLHWTAARNNHMASERFAGYYARKQTHLHKLAMVIAASKRDELVITMEDLQEANVLITDLEVDMQHVFSSIGVSQSAKISSEILNLIKNHKQITVQDLWKLCFNTTAKKDFSEAVTAIADAGYVKVFRGPLGPDGKPSQILAYQGAKPISPSVQKRQETAPSQADAAAGSESSEPEGQRSDEP
jgi:hypothetical protein